MIYLTGCEVKPTIFPDKTSQIWKIPERLFRSPFISVYWKFENEAEFMHLAQLKSLIDSYSRKADLYMPYFPYARQDKPVSNNETFALKPFCKLLNSLNFNVVASVDPHSSYIKEWVDNFYAIDPVDRIQDVIKEIGATCVLYPDFGALHRYTNTVRNTCSYALKTRNPSTGDIGSLDICDGYNLKDAVVLIVDDICDGGATFIKLCSEMEQHKPKEVHLYVSHGIFSRGLAPLRDAGIKRIFTFFEEVK